MDAKTPASRLEQLSKAKEHDSTKFKSTCPDSADEFLLGSQSENLTNPVGVRSDGVLYMSSNAGAVFLDTLHSPHLPVLLRALEQGSVAVVVIDGAVPTTVCEALASVIKSLPMQPYDVEPAFYKAAKPLYEAAARGSMDDYFSHGATVMRALQSRISPLMTPEAMLRLALDECWPGGAQLLRLNGRTCPFGLIREITAGGEVATHTDNSDIDFPHPTLQRARTNLSCVAYLSNCSGGEIGIRPVGFTTAEAIARYRLKGHPYAIDASLLPPVRVQLKPERGRMILFNAKFAHEVAPVATGSTSRITMSGFLLVAGDDQPILLYY
jgi:hypothetical protein